jgi:hypothetical protein
LGTKLVASLKRDPSIRIALENIASKIPLLYEEIRKGLMYTTEGVDGRPIKIKAGKLRDHVIGRKADDGSLLIDTRDARQNFKKDLLEKGLNSDLVESRLKEFDVAADLEPIEFPGGVVAIKRPIEKISPVIGNKLVDYRLPTLIALEFLALMI